MDGSELRRLILEIVKRTAESGSSSQSNTVLSEIRRELRDRKANVPDEAVLTFWNDLFRTGYLSWGMNFSNPGPPWFHLTEIGRKSLQQLSRDPANPAGYLADLDRRVQLDPVSRSYIEEAIHAFNAGCYRAAAVLTGGASEVRIVALRDTLTELHGNALPKSAKDWKASRILAGITQHLDSTKKAMPQVLRERYEVFFGALTGQIRILRNEAGHPRSIGGLDEPIVHASLLMFPEVAVLLQDLSEWSRENAGDV